MSQLVLEAAKENAEFFLNDFTKTGRELCYSFHELTLHCQKISPLLEKIKQVAPRYDLDSKTPGNGYRGFVVLLQVLFDRCLVLCRFVQQRRTQYIFYLCKYSAIQDLRSWNAMLISLTKVLEYLNTMLDSKTKDGAHCLFPAASSEYQLVQTFKAMESPNFYSRHVAFQYCPSMRNAMKMLLKLMVGYTDYYSCEWPHLVRLTKSLLMSFFYTFDDDNRARKIVDTSQTASIEFCKSFWFLPELGPMKALPALICPTVQVNDYLWVPMEPLELNSIDGKPVRLPMPRDGESVEPIQVKLLIAKRRARQISGVDDAGATDAASDSLIIHCHGGGFVSHTSKTHEIYLRNWANELDVPILCVEYSLAPEHPFPRQLLEILFVYAWVQLNPSVAGTTAKKIIFSGDSCGGNLALGVALLASKLNLRPPDGLLLAYPPLQLQLVPSPSRLFCLMDPILPPGFMLRCLNAYAGRLDVSASVQNEENGVELLKKEDEIFCSVHSSNVRYTKATGSDDELRDMLRRSPRNPLMSPYLASDDDLRKLPPIRLVSVELDPILDDAVEFAKRCRRLGCDVQLDILENIPHGFLNFALLSYEAKKGLELCIERLGQLLQKGSAS